MTHDVTRLYFESELRVKHKNGDNLDLV